MILQFALDYSQGIQGYSRVFLGYPGFPTSGNIVAETLCFLLTWPVCPPWKTLLRKQNLLTRKQYVSQEIQKHFCCGNNVS